MKSYVNEAEVSGLPYEDLAPEFVQRENECGHCGYVQIRKNGRKIGY